ncbi:MAG: NosD domain-containing protein, partial [Gemmatimonadota bacterium]
LQTSQDIVAEQNRIEGNRIGLFMDNATRSLFAQNAVAGNGIGVDMLSSAEGNRFAENAIVGNRTPVRRAGSGVNEWAVDGRGNYWGEVGLFDVDGDGVGDRSHRAGDPFASLSAGKPALSLFLGTPAARALSWAEKAFPVFDLAHVEDPRPLLRPPEGVPISTEARAPGFAGDLPALALAALLLGLVPLGLGRIGRWTRRTAT